MRGLYLNMTRFGKTISNDMKDESLKDKTAKGLFWGGVSNGVQQLLNLLFGLVLARILNAADYGMVGMLAIFSAIASTIQESGFTAALTNRREVRHEDYNAVFWFSSLTGLVFYCLLFLLAPLIADFYGKPELVLLSRILFLGFLLGGIGIAPNAFLFKNLMVKERAKIDIISLLSSGTIGIALALNGFAYYGLAVQTTTYIGVGALLKFFYSPWKPTWSFSIIPLREMITFSSKLILVNITTQVGNNIFSVILGKFYNERQVGYYTQGNKWMGMGYSQILGMITNVAQPVFSQVRDEPERAVHVLRKMFRFGAFLSFPLLLGLAFVAKEFIVLAVGEKWLPSVPFLQLFCIWGAFGFMSYLYTNVLIAFGKSTIYLTGNVIVLACQLIAVLLFSYWGIYYMVIAYVCVNLLTLLLWHKFVSVLINITVSQIFRDICPYLAVSILSCLIAWSSGNLLVMGNISTFVYKIVVFAFVYIGILWACGSVLLKDSVNFLLKRKKDGI